MKTHKNMDLVDRVEACIEMAISCGHYPLGETLTGKVSFDDIMALAVEVGIEAGRAITPTPMKIRGYEPIADGVCGFAQVNIKGNTAFGRWVKKMGYGRKAYYGGLDINVHEFNQSYERKMAYANAMAKVFTSHGIEAFASGRLD